MGMEFGDYLGRCFKGIECTDIDVPFLGHRSDDNKSEVVIRYLSALCFSFRPYLPHCCDMRPEVSAINVSQHTKVTVCGKKPHTRSEVMNIRK